MIRILVAVPILMMLLACGRFAPDGAQVDGSAEQVVSPASRHDDSHTVLPTPASDVPVLPRHGDTSVEEKILNADIVVRATMSSMSSDIVVYPEDYADPVARNKHGVVLKFNLNVSEYLKGSGLSSIVAVWLHGGLADTHAEAEGWVMHILGDRDDQWDDREAVMFLFDVTGTAFGSLFGREPEFAKYYYFGVGVYGDDLYSLDSKYFRKWLPGATTASAASDSASDGREFLLDVPSPTGKADGAGTSSATPKISLGELKKRIKDIAAEVDAGDGSEAYRKCVLGKYEMERLIRHFRELDGSDYYDKSPVTSTLASGQPSGTVLHEGQNYGIYPNTMAKTWFEGADSALLAVMHGEATPYEIDHDGILTAGADGIEYTESLTTARPLPAGEYSVVRREVWARFLACNHVLDHDWTITVTAPSGTLHEMFFDPVVVGTAVAADATNGALKPRAFTGASGAAATISRIAYEPPSSGSGQSGVVKVNVTPDGALSGQAVDFIGLDGTVSLSLGVAAATADSVAGTLSWPVATQPWKAGDQLMVRIGPAPPAPAAPAGLTAAAGNASVTLAWDDPSNSTITGYEYQMRWTGVGWQAWVAIPNSGASTTSHAVTGLTNGTEYRFKVRAVNAGGAGQAAPSADPWYVAATPQAPPPAAPTGLTATAGKGSVTLTWSDPSDSSITRYEYRMRWTGVGWQAWVAIPNSGAATTSHKVTGLTNGTEHRFQVRAVNAAGAGKAAPNAHPWYVSATP